MHSLRKYQYLNLINKESILRNQHISALFGPWTFILSTSNQTTFEVCISMWPKRFGCHASPQGISRCYTGGESEGSIAGKWEDKRGDPPWLWNPGQTSLEFQNRGVSGSPKRLISSKIKIKSRVWVWKFEHYSKDAYKVNVKSSCVIRMHCVTNCPIKTRSMDFTNLFRHQ